MRKKNSMKFFFYKNKKIEAFNDDIFFYYKIFFCLKVLGSKKKHLPSD